MALRLYDYAASANCLKVRLLLAHLSREYERVPVDIFDGDTLTDEFAALNPARSTPVLELESGEHLQESNAILIYLAEGTELLPDEPFERAQVLRWLFFEQADLVPAIGGLRFRLITGRIAADGPAVERRRAAGHDVLRLLDAHLSERDFMAAERFSAADIGIYGYTHVAPEAGIELAPYPAVRAWIERVESQSGHVNDLEPYPPNAQEGVSRSIYDRY
jgi:glutathione S-transferase